MLSGLKGETMDRAIALTQLRALGLTVSKAGVISHGGYDYGTLGSMDIQTMNNEYVPLDNIAQFSWVEANHDLFAIDAEDNETRIHADIYSPKDMEAIELRKMPKALVDLSAVFYELYPDADQKMYFDELNECDMVDVSLFGETGGPQMMDDKLFAIYVADVQSKLRSHGFLGNGFPSEAVMGRALDIVTYHNRRNMFKEWVEVHEWDGVPRVRTWFKKKFGATAPPLRSIGKEDYYLEQVSEMWFVGVIRRQYHETKHEIVPVLISDQGIGKGNNIKMMAGQDCWYVESTESINHRKEFLDSIKGAVIVELSEAKQLKDDDARLLKGFISASKDNYRKPYAKYSKPYPRRFGLIATSNDDTIFKDETGGRRYFPMYLDPSQSEYMSHYDVEQVWAEALVLLKEGHLWYTDEDIEEVAAIMQDFGMEEDSNVDAINQWLDDPINGYTEVGSLVSKNIILEKVFSVDPALTRTAIPRNIQDIFSRWSNGSKSWERVAKTVRLGGEVCRVWERKAPPGFKKKKERLKNSAVKSDDMKRNPVELMRKYCREHKGVQPGDVFDDSEFDQNQINLLLGGGFIYVRSGVGENQVYAVGDVL